MKNSILDKMNSLLLYCGLRYNYNTALIVVVVHSLEISCCSNLVL